MLANSFLYFTIFLQVIANTLFHFNWIRKNPKVPLLLTISYGLAFSWSFVCIYSILKKLHNLDYFDSSILDIISSFCLTASLIFATYYTLTLKPINIPKANNTPHYYFAFPIHLFMYAGLLLLTMVFNLVTNSASL